MSHMNKREIPRPQFLNGMKTLTKKIDSDGQLVVK